MKKVQHFYKEAHACHDLDMCEGTQHRPLAVGGEITALQSHRCYHFLLRSICTHCPSVCVYLGQSVYCATQRCNFCLAVQQLTFQTLLAVLLCALQNPISSHIVEI